MAIPSSVFRSGPGLVLLPLAALAGAALAAGLVRLAPSGEGPALAAAVLIGAFALWTLGGLVPGLRRIGGAVLATLLVPSWLVHAGFVPEAGVAAVRAAMDRTHVLEIFLTVAVSGSVLASDRGTLLRSARLMVPLLLTASAAIAAGGLLAGSLLGQPPREVLFFTLLPMMSNGLAAGLVPISVGYAPAFGLSTAEVMARILPPLLISNIAMILAAGWICGTAGRAALLAPRPGAGVGADDDGRLRGVGRVAGALAGGVAVYGAIVLAARQGAALTGMSAPLAVILIALALSLTSALPDLLRSGAIAVYRGLIAWGTCPLVCVVGLVYVPWAEFLAGLEPARLTVILAGLAALWLACGTLARQMGQERDTALLLAATRVAMGATGAAAILSAGRRMDLMGLAQVLVRFGGVATVSLALLLA